MYTYLADIIKESGNTEYLTCYLTAWDVGGLIGSFGIGFLIDKFKNPAVLMLIILFALALSFALLNVTIQVPF